MQGVAHSHRLVGEPVDFGQVQPSRADVAEHDASAGRAEIDGGDGDGFHG
jgi:hypothetical protein